MYRLQNCRLRQVVGRLSSVPAATSLELLGGRLVLHTDRQRGGRQKARLATPRILFVLQLVIREHALCLHQPQMQGDM